MAIRKILQIGDEALRKVCRRVDSITPRIISLLDDMAETMYEADGVGLAAPQVGILRRICVIDTGEGIIELINPEIISASGEIIEIEGCLSILGRQGLVARPEKVVVRAYNRNGELVEYEGVGLFRKALCHEIDHLDGILYTDKMIEEVINSEGDS